MPVSSPACQPHLHRGMTGLTLHSRNDYVLILLEFLARYTHLWSMGARFKPSCCSFVSSHYLANSDSWAIEAWINYQKCTCWSGLLMRGNLQWGNSILKGWGEGGCRKRMNDSGKWKCLNWFWMRNVFKEEIEKGEEESSFQVHCTCHTACATVVCSCHVPGLQ